MELILKKDNKTLEFVSGSQEVNVNDDLVQIISVMPEMPLSVNESLWVAFEQNGTVAHTLPLFGKGKYTTDIPQAIIDLGGEWEFQILRRRYATSEHEGGFIQTASNKGAFTIGEGVKTVDGTLITTAMLTTLYREVLEDKAIIKEQVAEAITQVETAVEKVSDLEKDIALLNTALMQGGIIYKADTETAYNERITAGGLNVLDGSLAVLKKVVGSTIKTSNLYNPANVRTNDTENCTEVEWLDGNYGVIAKGNSSSTALGNYANGWVYPGWSVSNTSKRGVSLKSGDIVYVSADITLIEQGSLQAVVENRLYASNNSVVMQGGNKTISTTKTRYTWTYTISTDSPSYYPVFTLSSNKVKIENITISLDEAKPFTPYFEGLKNASFAGIESTNADGTEVSTLNFSKTELGEWDEIDFENQKVVNGGEELTQDTAFTEEQLAVYSEYIISVDGKTIRYKLTTPTETPFTDEEKASGDEYLARVYGTERVRGNDNAKFGAKNTLLQNYIVVKE